MISIQSNVQKTNHDNVVSDYTVGIPLILTRTGNLSSEYPASTFSRSTAPLLSLVLSFIWLSPLRSHPPHSFLLRETFLFFILFLLPFFSSLWIVHRSNQRVRTIKFQWSRIVCPIGRRDFSLSTAGEKVEYYKLFQWKIKWEKSRARKCSPIFLVLLYISISSWVCEKFWAKDLAEGHDENDNILEYL